MKTLTIILLAGICVIACFHPAFAQTDTIFATYTYTMGDNETKADALERCILYAKKKCVEQAGTFVEGEFSLSKSEQLGTKGSSFNESTQQDISTFTGAFMKVDVVSEEMNY